MIMNRKGITLVALIVTIIVLLILAGVSIATLTGENGIFSQAQNSKLQSIIGEEREAITIAFNGAKLQKLGGNVTAEDMNTQFGMNGTKATAENEDEIAKYRGFDIIRLKNDKLRMESKLSALENKLQKHKKHLMDVIELEKKEVLLVYQEYLTEVQLDEEQIGKVLTDNDLFEDMIYPMKFLKLYESVKK